MLLAGLILICLGAGGIKPCVSANVGDQFGESNKHLLSKMFGWFYFSINAGSFISSCAKFVAAAERVRPHGVSCLEVSGGRRSDRWCDALGSPRLSARTH